MAFIERAKYLVAGVLTVAAMSGTPTIAAENST